MYSFMLFCSVGDTSKDHCPTFQSKAKITFMYVLYATYQSLTHSKRAYRRLVKNLFRFFWLNFKFFVKRVLFMTT